VDAGAAKVLAVSRDRKGPASGMVERCRQGKVRCRQGVDAGAGEDFRMSGDFAVSARITRAGLPVEEREGQQWLYI